MEWTIAVFIMALVAMVLHESAHALVAFCLGDETAKRQGRLTLNPLKHLDPMMSVALPVFLAMIHAPIFGGAKPVPVDSRFLKGGKWGMALVAIAGPLTNFVLAFISFALAYACGFFLHGATLPNNFMALLLLAGLQVNLGFAIFNILPLPPLDGSRVLMALAPDFVQPVFAFLERYAFVVLFCLVFGMAGALDRVMFAMYQGALQLFYAIIGLPG